MSYGFKIIVEGEYACFTRPEMKVERVSYDVPTPGAIEGLLKSIYWKPSLRYVVDKIIVFHRMQFVNVRRNEVKNKISLASVRAQMRGKDESPELYASEVRTQRAGMLLKDVKYGIEFHFELTGIQSEAADESEDKHFNILLRRLKKGQWFKTPCLGCREFAVEKIVLTDEFDLSQVDAELAGDVDLGFMLYAMQFEDGGRPLNDDWETPSFSDNAQPLFYRPHMIDGVIDVHKYRGETTC